MSRTLGAGVWGAGWVSTEHLKARKNNPHCQVVAMGSRRVETVRQRLAEAGVANVEGHTDFDKFLRQPSLDVVSICLPAHIQAEHAIRAARAEIELIKTAAELGARVLVVHMAIFAEPSRLIVKDGKCYPGFTVDRDLEEWPPVLGKIHERLGAYVRTAEQTGVALALETDWQSSHRLIEFVEPFDPRFCGICFDTGHAQIDSDAVALAQLLGPRVITTHLHDNDGKDDQHLPPFEGAIDWPDMIAGLKAAGYAGLWTFETMEGTLDDLKDARERITELWKRA